MIILFQLMPIAVLYTPSDTDFLYYFTLTYANTTILRITRDLIAFILYCRAVV